jgi:hypothetical protein
MPENLPLHAGSAAASFRKAAERKRAMAAKFTRTEIAQHSGAEVTVRSSPEAIKALENAETFDAIAREFERAGEAT